MKKMAYHHVPRYFNRLYLDIRNSTFAIFRKMSNNPSLRALAKQSRSEFQLRIGLDCNTSFAKMTLFALFSKKSKVEYYGFMLLLIKPSGNADSILSDIPSSPIANKGNKAAVATQAKMFLAIMSMHPHRKHTGNATAPSAT